jgi:glucokinase
VAKEAVFKVDPILGVDLGGTLVRAGKVRGGELERHEAHRISGREEKDVVLDEIFRVIDQVFDNEVTGIGFGVPSVVDVERGIVYAVENIPSWQEVPLKDELERRYGVPTYINNDANAFAVGELYFGQGRGRRNLVGMTLGTGLGAGIIVDGCLYSGTSCGAGELGPIPYREHTIEHYCSGAFFQRAGGGDEIFRRAREGDPEALRLYREFGFELGHAILVALYAYDPELIVLGGSISRAFPLFEEGMRERLRTYAYQHALAKVEIKPSEIEHAAILGAAALYLDARGRTPGPTPTSAPPSPASDPKS